MQKIASKARSNKQQTSFGAQSEQVVASWLVKEGYTILANNYRQRSGEIDLVVSKGAVLAFVEVKARVRSYFHLSSVITPTKQQRIFRAASHFLARTDIKNRIIRFDVALVQQGEITYIPNAFVPGDQGAG